MPLQSLVELGHGHTATYLWRPTVDRNDGIPAAILERHGACSTVVPWVKDWPGARFTWTLRSLHPLTLEEPMRCTRCGQSGTIREGTWSAL